MTDAAIVSDPEEKRPIGAFSSERRERQPEGQSDVLHEVVPVGGGVRIGRSEAADRCAVCRQSAGELRYEPGPNVARHVEVRGAVLSVRKITSCRLSASWT
jgi:hypothetical protein